MLDTAATLRLLTPGVSPDTEGLSLIDSVEFEHPALAWKRLQALSRTTAERESLARAMPANLPGQPFKSAPRPGRNDPCPCGSGRKYKQCCGRN